MRIVCPSCAAEYEVPAARLTPRRMVRCARCGGEWSAVQETEETLPDPRPAETQRESPVGSDMPTPALTAMDRLAAPAPHPRRSAGLTAAWVVTVVILVAAVAATVTWREAITRAWPPSSRILGSAAHMVPDPGGEAAVPQPAKE